MDKLKSGDKVAIVSLSSGILGEKFVDYELELGVKRLKEFGLIPVFMPNSLKGLDFIKNNPEARANDLKLAFKDKSIKAIFCAIGGNDTILTIPYLINDEDFKKKLKENPKIFCGFSDSTANHIMLNVLGLNTFYGPAFLPDFAEFENDMLPYTKNAVSYFFNPSDNYEIKSSDVWYEDRKDFSKDAVGTNRVSHKETKGYEVLQGNGKVQGKLFGGCIELVSLLFAKGQYGNEDLDEKCKNTAKELKLLSNMDIFNKKILFLETSDQKIKPEIFRKIIQDFKFNHMFDNIKGLIFGKPIDEIYYDEYKKILTEELKQYNFPVMINFNFGHSYPRTVLPYGATAELDATNKKLIIIDNPFNN